MSNNSGFEQISYADQVVIVTGAASGIGKSAAQLIASRGGVVICVDLNQAGLDQTVSEIKTTGGIAESAILDISNQSAVMDLVATLGNKHKRIDALASWFHCEENRLIQIYQINKQLFITIRCLIKQTKLRIHRPQKNERDHSERLEKRAHQRHEALIK